MRTTTLLLAAALLTAAPLAAQNTALAVGPGARGVVRVTAITRIPAFVGATETAALVETHRGNGFTEFLATYTVRGNVAWTLDATTVPEGVTVLDATGAWTATPATIGLGEPTNTATLLVRVRVADGTAAGWAEGLRIEALQKF